MYDWSHSEKLRTDLIEKCACVESVMIITGLLYYHFKFNICIWIGELFKRVKTKLFPFIIATTIMYTLSVHMWVLQCLRHLTIIGIIKQFDTKRNYNDQMQSVYILMRIHMYIQMWSANSSVHNSVRLCTVQNVFRWQKTNTLATSICKCISVCVHP